MKIGDLVKVSEAYSFPSDIGRIKGLVTQILEPSPVDWRARVEVMVFCTETRPMYRASFLAEELEVAS